MNIPFTRNGKLDDTYYTKDSSYIIEIDGCTASSNAGTFTVPSDAIKLTKSQVEEAWNAYFLSKLIFVLKTSDGHNKAIVTPIAVNDRDIMLEFTIPQFFWAYGSTSSVQAVRVSLTEYLPD